jgi:hypothetical protein
MPCSNSEISIAFIREKDEFVEIRFLQTLVLGKAKTWRARARNFGLLFAALAIPVLIMNGPNRASLKVCLGSLIALLVFWPVIEWVWVSGSQSRHKKLYEKRYDLYPCRSHRFDLTDVGYIETCECGREEVSWEVISNWYESWLHFCLVHRNGSTAFIPKRPCDASQLEALRSLLQLRCTEVKVLEDRKSRV